MYRFLFRCLTPLVLTAMAASPALAAVNVSVRVEGRPQGPDKPIQVFVRVTDEVSGASITDLFYENFEIMIDPEQGVVPETLQEDLFHPPQEVDLEQHVSVVFVMDYSSSLCDTDDAGNLDCDSNTSGRTLMEEAVIDFISNMREGDKASVVKFNNDSGAIVVTTPSFIEITANNQALTDVVREDIPGDGSNILDATLLAVQQFSLASDLPEGPKAVILLTDGRDSHSNENQTDLIETASGISIPIFTIGVGSPGSDGRDLLGELAGETGGIFFDTTVAGAVNIADAYLAVQNLLTGEYLIEILGNTIDDCDVHKLQVTVEGETESKLFTRRACITTPTSFTFAPQTNVAPGTLVTSSTETIDEIEAAAHISVINGSYSIDCTATFTADPGTITDGQTVCVQQTSSSQPSTSKTTTLTVGGFAATFTTTTRAQSGGGGGGGGGGGASGLLELLLGLSLVFMRRRLTA